MSQGKGYWMAMAVLAAAPTFGSSVFSSSALAQAAPAENAAPTAAMP